MMKTRSVPEPPKGAEGQILFLCEKCTRPFLAPYWTSYDYCPTCGHRREP